jgi:hypothetical protein
MAQTCALQEDTIYIMIDEINMVNKQYDWAKETPSIWLLDELVELQKLFDVGSIKKGIAIKYPTFEQYDVTETLFGKQATLKDRSPERARELRATVAMQRELVAQRAKDIMSGEYDQSLTIAKRDSNFLCTDSYQEEDSNMDYFG